jgi:nicotinate-nucleotide adenylyltransferase
MAVRPAARTSGASTTEALADPLPQPDGSALGPRIGILGGTFDPLHIGHLWLATLATDSLNLDRVLLMPAARPPHKRGQRLSNAADRIAMIRLAIAGDPRLEVSLVEMERPGPSYTVDSLSELRSRYGDASALVLIMAADTFAQIDSWREPDRILELAEWAVGPRPGSDLPEPGGLRARFGAAAARIHLLEGPALEVSGTVLRRRVAAGRTIRYLVPAAVESFIHERGLYRRSGGS